MQITYLVIITIITIVLGSITKAFIGVIPNKFIPLQNVLIGFLAGFLSYVMKIQPNLIESLILCLMATTGAGGIYDLATTKYKSEKEV